MGSEPDIEFIKVFLFRSGNLVDQTNHLPNPQTQQTVCLRELWWFFCLFVCFFVGKDQHHLSHEVAEPLRCLI